MTVIAEAIASKIVGEVATMAGFDIRHKVSGDVTMDSGSGTGAVKMDVDQDSLDRAKAQHDNAPSNKTFSTGLQRIEQKQADGQAKYDGVKKHAGIDKTLSRLKSRGLYPRQQLRAEHQAMQEYKPSHGPYTDYKRSLNLVREGLKPAEKEYMQRRGQMQALPKSITQTMDLSQLPQREKEKMVEEEMRKGTKILPPGLVPSGVRAAFDKWAHYAMPGSYASLSGPSLRRS